MTRTFGSADRRQRAAASLAGLSVGDALGAQFFVPANREHFEARTVPPAPWDWTDDTQMAWVLTEHLREFGEVRQDDLAAAFAAEFDLYRGYGPGAGRLLRLVRDGGDWRELSAAMFGGSGSFGNGAAMRVAPLGAWFADDLDRAAGQAALSAEITHRHGDGVAGAVAVALAAALASADETPEPGDLFTEVIGRLDDGKVRRRLERARAMPRGTEPADVARELGNGSHTGAHDTVPFCLWVAAHELADFRKSFWDTASAGGDVDTTCAIVGGIVAANTGPDGIAAEWLRSREALPENAAQAS
ncbi:ADP-ribosylglycohydrolase family protein [Phytomonospora sp. NPDC050363]|uniref:ADP-ribosylglycohydrolase family protein n=1 Tax=Phytomonospora sp. NPDC050363 TaxID=3155642 RepID=UPI0033C30DCD